MTTTCRSRPVSLRISVTDRCQLRCMYCMPPAGVAWVGPECVLSYEEITRFVAVALKRFGVSKVHLTGGEPLLRAQVPSLVAMLSGLRVPDIALTTNGQQLAHMVADLRRAGLHRINVSLDTLHCGAYAALTGGGDVARVLEGVDAALAAGFSAVKINTLVLRGHNDAEVVSLARWAFDRGCTIRFLELMPVGPAAAMHSALFVSMAEVRKRIESAFHLIPAGDRGGTGVLYQATERGGRRGTIGFIPSESRPFCSGCRRLRLTSTGRLVGCLALGAGQNVRHLLDSSRDEEGLLTEAIGAALSLKRSTHEFHTPHLMSQTGG